MLINPLMEKDKSQRADKNVEEVSHSSVRLSATDKESDEKGVVNGDADSHDRDSQETPNLRRVFRLICLTNLWTILLTFIPVGVDIPPNNYYKVS